MNVLKRLSGFPVQTGSRYHLRCCVHRSRNGCVSHFQSVVEHFTDLVFEYLSVSGFNTRKTIHREAEKIFLRLWSQMPLASRVSDVERLIWLQLSRLPLDESGFLNRVNELSPWWKEIASLSPEERFLLVAREMEGWSTPWLALATRNRGPELDEKLFQMRMHLLRDVLPPLNPTIERKWRDFSICWDRRRDPAFCRELEKSASTNPDIRIFKTSWIERRCELIEFRQNCRLSDNGKKLFLHQLTTRVATRERFHPPLRTKLVNSIHFTSIPRFDHA